MSRRPEYHLPPTPEEVQEVLKQEKRKGAVTPEVKVWIEEVASQEIQKMIRRTIMNTILGLRESEINDIAQEATANAIHALQNNKFKQRAPLVNWVCHIARNAAIDHVRRKTRKREDQIEPSELPLHEGGQRAWEHKHDFKRILERLPKNIRDIMDLHIYRGYKLEEVAHELRIPLSTVKNRFYRGLGLLRKFYIRTSALEA